jgi:hypothetical protein
MIAINDRNWSPLRLHAVPPLQVATAAGSGKPGFATPAQRQKGSTCLWHRMYRRTSLSIFELRLCRRQRNLEFAGQQDWPAKRRLISQTLGIQVAEIRGTAGKWRQVGADFFGLKETRTCRLRLLPGISGRWFIVGGSAVSAPDVDWPGQSAHVKTATIRPGSNRQPEHRVLARPLDRSVT